MIRHCEEADFETILAIVNEAARAYDGVIPADRYHEPYMPAAELRGEIDAGVEFWAWEEAGTLRGVMGVQDVKDVTLIRHAYVRPADQGRGIGARLLAHLRAQTTRPLMIGTWADAAWAIRFYEKHGFERTSAEQKAALLRRYWSVPERQIETSVVLAEPGWLARAGASGGEPLG
jgi:GNAT superfamily N-acetyltransferase